MKRFLALVLLYLAALLPAQGGVPCSLPFTLTNGTLADANQVMANYNALVACLGNAAAAGANNDITALNGLTTPISPGQGGTNVYIGGTSTGGPNAQIVATTTPNSFTLAPGQRVVFSPGFTNTGPATLNVHATTATAITRLTSNGVIPLIGGELVAGQITEAIYDGTEYVLSPIPGQSGGFGPRTALASAGVTDLGLVVSHNVQITGNTTITSFGASANTALPVYLLTFTGGLLLTFSSPAMILPGLTSITTATNDSAVALYLGSGNWQIVAYARASGTALINPIPLPGALGWKAVNNTATPTTLIDYSADFVTLFNPSFNTSTAVQSISGTINSTNQNVINGIDGPRAASTWYKLFIMNNGSTTGGYLSSTAATNCSGFTNPLSGYNFCVYLGSFRTDASANFLSMQLVGAMGNYITKASGNTTTLPFISTATLTFPSAISISTFVPPSATRIKLSLNAVANTTQATVAPNANYASTGVVNPAPCFIYGATAAGVNGGGTLNCEFALESNQVFYGGSSGLTSLQAYGWVDKVNAN
jgi:hypothetical protein